MLQKLRQYTDKLLRKARLKPLSLAEKCRLQFGAAVVFSLVLALLIPYFWMGKLTMKTLLDTGRGIADTVFERHFQVAEKGEKDLPLLMETGFERQENDRAVRWIRLDTEQPQMQPLSLRQKKVIRELEQEKQRADHAWLDKSGRLPMNNYIQMVRAKDSCLGCHSPQGSATPYNKGQLLGAIVIRTSAREIARIELMNRIMTIVAGLLAGTGAMVAFYLIAQRVILRPIRQLRALVANIADGNLDARSSIRTGDEYEKLATAFNDMLDGLQDSQEKLRQANKQLDAKIAQLSERNIELFKANKLKSEFLANISHEFRTPLNAILGFAELLREKPGDDIEKSKRYASNIVTSGRNLLNLINDLLDLAKAEAGKMQLHIEKTNIHRLCQGLISFFAPLSDDKMIHVRLSASDDLPLITTDPSKLQQILYNLLSNAIKFTPENGTIQIIAKPLDDTTVRISVSDTGPGIAEELHADIFEKFRQIDGSITRDGTGTGLGLAICKELTHLLAGNISIESQAGQGSTFHIDIPVNLKAAEEQEKQKTAKST